MGDRSHVPHVRAPAVAGLFYPDDPAELNASLDTLLSGGHPSPGHVKALVVPHAGYIYSGPTAGCAYNSLGPQAKRLRRVVLMGPSHRVGFEGVAIPSATAFLTPLGETRLDTHVMDRLRPLRTVVEDDWPHALEHSLEVQLPFLQRVVPEAEIVPIVTGDVSATEVESVLEAVWGGPETLIVISSDLSHYHPYTLARTEDASTAQAIVEERDDLRGEQACGCAGINGLNRVARRRGMRAEVLDLRNSGDTAGDERRVVGYGAFGFFDV